MKIGYYPGCSLHATAREFDQSLKAICGPLGVELTEIDDWSCCGATSAHATNHLLAVSLAARNLALAEAQGLAPILAPCAACYSRLATARHEIGEDAALASKVKGIIERPAFGNSVKVQSIAEVLRDLEGAIRGKAVKPLQGLKVACYYGCLLVRPQAVTGFDDVEAPSSMETAVRAAGGEPVEWRMKLECCGGGFSMSRTASVLRLGRAIIDDARAAGAHAIAVACPMCHSNLDFRQGAMARGDGVSEMPILFITQVVGLGLGLSPEALGLKKHFVDTAPVMHQIASVATAAAKAEEVA
ncbi:MAG: CoB--CoM heterodisulfide reductase iron-sulfur subunit B family protein [Proteobacteria bacterium]|jgi:heterodisulfide reductase subunit B|nr:CoB--CoM heterodisulfide reductase iron-sulfur subunit B family protein [Pseudomonadota bacterium]